MTNDMVEFVSVCRISEDYNGRIWLTRIADINDQQLSVPYKSNRSTTYFENRDRLYRNDGPSQVDTIGVWRWTATPNLNDSETDYVQSFFVSDILPIRVVVSQGVKSTQKLIESLKDGSVWTKPYICDTLFCYERTWGNFIGVLCRPEEFVVCNQYAKLKDTTYSLPCFSFQSSDIYNWDDKNLRFMRRIRLGEPEKYIPVGNVDELIRTTISDRMSWKLYKDCIGKTKAEWRDCKALFDRACMESLYEEVLEKLGCPLEIASENVEQFVKRAGSLIQEGDIDSDVLAQIALNHDALRAQCEAAVKSQWLATHAEEIATAQSEIDQKHKDAADAEAAYKKLLADTSKAQSKLNSILKKIEEYEALGTKTVQAIHDKIGLAQQDMAGFIAELSAFMPQQSMQSGSTNRWTFIPGEVCHSMDNLEGCSSWRDTFELLCDNLQLAGIGSQWTTMLSSFLYSSYLNRMPLLLAGPNANAIADALSITICGQKIDLLKCCGEQDAEAISGFVESDMAAVQNPFHPDWVSCISHSNNGFALWLHPFTEDLQIEPRSLYHYAYPVFTECFVDQLPSVENMDAGQETVEYDEFKPDPKYRAKMGPVKKLGLSRLMLSRLEKVLADAKCIGSISDTSMECLFGMLPMCVLSGKQEALTELLDSEKNIKSEVRAELQRYVEE